MAADEAGLPAGTECTALYHQDGGWYDAVIVKALPQGKYQVNFVEYGNMVRRVAFEFSIWTRSRAPCLRCPPSAHSAAHTPGPRAGRGHRR
jgi:hypothetical protein